MFSSCPCNKQLYCTGRTSIWNRCCKKIIKKYTQVKVARVWTIRRSGQIAYAKAILTQPQTDVKPWPSIGAQTYAQQARPTSMAASWSTKRRPQVCRVLTVNNVLGKVWNELTLLVRCPSEALTGSSATQWPLRHSFAGAIFVGRTYRDQNWFQIFSGLHQLFCHGLFRSLYLLLKF